MKKFMDENRKLVLALKNEIKQNYPRVNVDLLLMGIYNDKPTDFYEGLASRLKTEKQFVRYVLDCALKAEIIHARLEVLDGKLSREKFYEQFPETVQ